MRFFTLFSLLLGLHITTIAQESETYGKLVVKSAFLKKFCVKGTIIESLDEIIFEPEPTEYLFKKLVLNKQELIRSKRNNKGVWLIQTRQERIYVFKPSPKS